jgi:EcsC family protein
MRISKEELADLKKSFHLLENPGIAAKLTNALGKPIEKSLDFLPQKWSTVVRTATKTAIEKALDFAILSMGGESTNDSTDKMHKFVIAITGATGGFFGTPALVIELPVSTTVMLRSIADIARSEGEDLKSIESKLACVEVLAIGGKSKADDAAETGYYAVRSALATTLSEASHYIAGKGVAQKGAPVLVRLINTVASRFSIVVSEKVSVQLIPIIGAIGGALINVIFIDHFQDMARGHFIIRRLERRYGKDLVKKEYEKLENDI